MLRPTLLLLAVGLSGLAARGVWAGDEPAASDKFTLERVDLSTWTTPGGFRGASLAAPSDLAGENASTLWTVGEWSERGSPRPAWIEFDGAEGLPDAPVFTVDALIETIKARGVPDERVSLVSDGQALVIQGPAALVAETRARADWAVAVLAPTARIEARLAAEGREAGVKAQGSALLHAGHWARLWLQEQRAPYVVDWDVEIAQGSTMMNPVEVALPEGQELYVRWFPGETVSLLEVWSGDLEHLDPMELDLSPVRGAPEGSGPGTARLPRTAVNRAFTALLLPAGGSATYELAWQGAAGARRLRLTLDGASPAVAPVAHGQNAQTRVVPLHLGAVGRGLLFDSRPSRIDRLNEDLNALVNGMGGDGSLNSLPEGGIALGQGSPAVLEAWGAYLRKQEAALSAGTLKLRVVAVPEESVRGPLADRTLAAGALVPEGLGDRLRAAGAVDGQGLTLPLTSGVKAGFRCGSSVAGLMGFDVEVAQESGASDPVMGAMFDGLAGEALLSNGPSGLEVRVEALLRWADPRAGSVVMTFRAPVGMDFNREKVGSEPADVRHPAFPLLGGGGGEIQARWTVGPKDAGERLLGVVMHGSDALLLLASFSAP